MLNDARCPRYFGGCRPGLVAHLSAFSRTWSWLGRTGGLEPFGIFGSWIVLSMIDLLGFRAYAFGDEFAMNKPLILLCYFTN